MKSILLFIAAALLLNLGCGIKGPPLPPIETVGEKLNSAQPASGDATVRESTK